MISNHSDDVWFEQTEPSQLWVIKTLNANMTPIAECYSEDENKRLYPTEVKAMSNQEIQIRFSQPQSGKAYII